VACELQDLGTKKPVLPGRENQVPTKGYCNKKGPSENCKKDMKFVESFDLVRRAMQLGGGGKNGKFLARRAGKVRPRIRVIQMLNLCMSIHGRGKRTK